MRLIPNRPGAVALIALAAMPLTSALHAQENASAEPQIVVTGTPLPDPATLAEGPELKGIISARNGEKIQVTTADGTRTAVFISPSTKVKASAGLFGGAPKVGTEALLNGLPVTVRTRQWEGGLLASQVTFKNGDLKTANMIHNGTDQRFAQQTAATEALRGRMADIDKYNIKSTTDVHFDSGRWVISAQDKAELCSTAAQAEATDNALMLVVGYTDSDGSEEYNQQLSEKRASSVINYLQQQCKWKPYRMLTPTGMAEADPLASNDTPEGKAQNRRVSVNVLVSKGLDGI